MAKKRARFRVGEVVALWRREPTTIPLFFRIKAFYYDQNDELRYVFDARDGDSLANTLCPIEELISPLTAREIGQGRKGK